jgi:excisionase family DNA binding protein
MQTTETSGLLTTHEVARLLNVGTARVRQLADLGRLRATRTACGWRLYDPADVRRYLEAREARQERRPAA